MKESVALWRGKLIETVVEQDESLMSAYLEGKEPSVEDIKRVLRKAVISNALVPILCGSALKNKGVQLLLDAVVAYLPSPLDLPPVEGFLPEDEETKVFRKPSDEEPFTALAFKVATDPFVGKLCFFRVYAGNVHAGSYILNTSTGKKGTSWSHRAYACKYA